MKTFQDFLHTHSHIHTHILSLSHTHTHTQVVNAGVSVVIGQRCCELMKPDLAPATPPGFSWLST